MLKKVIAAAALTAQLATSLPSQAYFGQQAIENIASLPAKAVFWAKEHPYKTAAIIGGALALGTALSHMNPNNVQTGGDGQGLGYIVMLGNNLDFNYAPTTDHQKELFFQTLPGIIQSRLPKAQFCLIDGVNYNEWRKCYKNFADQGVTKVNNIIAAHGEKYGPISELTTRVSNKKSNIVFNRGLKNDFFGEYPNIAHELILLSCYSGDIDAKTLGIPVFSSSKPDSETLGSLATNWISFLKNSNHAVPTSAEEFYHMYSNYSASVTMTGGNFVDILLDIAQVISNKASCIRTFRNNIFSITNNFLWPVQSLIRMTNQALERFIPFMPLYQDAMNNITLGKKEPCIDLLEP